MARISLKNKRIVISGTDVIAGAATAHWLLNRGARVTVVGAKVSADMEKRINAHLRRSARDGDAYNKMRARLTWTSDRTMKTTNLNELFLSGWKKKVIGVTGMHGKSTTVMWAGHLIGDAVVAGHMPDRPLLPALDSTARIAVIKLAARTPVSTKIAVVSTDTMSSLDAAIEAARLAGVPEQRIQQRISTLPQVPLRQEVIHESPKLTVVNDALATQPARGISALRRWGGPTCVLICGGEGANFDYREWARTVQQQVRRTNLVLLAGSATPNMRAALGAYGRGIRAYDTLEAALDVARTRAGLYISSVILYSPAAKRGDTFAGEIGSGQRFSALIGKELG